MSLKGLSGRNRDAIDNLAGITGFGWTASLLGFLGSVLGYGNWLISRLVTEPQSLLYVGLVCFLATVGLDRLANRLSEQ